MHTGGGYGVTRSDIAAEWKERDVHGLAVIQVVIVK